MKDTTERKRIISPGKALERFWSIFIILIMVIGGLQNLRIFPVQASPAPAPAQQATTTNTLGLAVVSATDGTPITTYEYFDGL